jgi:hypothetical protein
MLHDPTGQIFGWIKKAVNAVGNWIHDNIETIVAVAVVVGLVALTIATAGVASPLLVGALIGACIGGGVSIATQLVFTGTVDLKQFFIDIGVGALLGAVGGSAVGKVGMAIAGAGIGVGSGVVSDVAAGRSIDWGAAALGGAMGAVPGIRGKVGAKHNFIGEWKTTRYHQNLIKNNPVFTKPGFSGAINFRDLMGRNANKILNAKACAAIIKNVPHNLIYSSLSSGISNTYRYRSWF